VKKIQVLSGEVSKKDFCASNRQTDSKNGLFPELTTEHPRDRLQKGSQDGLVNLALQFGYDELASYTEYRKTELTRKSAD
jgi:hypothetical protein